MALLVFEGSEMDQPMCVDIHLASRRDATATSAGQDESFAVSQPNAIPWTNLTFDEALAACGRAGKYICDQRVHLTIGGPVDYVNRRVDQFVSRLEPTGPETSVADETDTKFPPAASREPYPDTVNGIATWSSVHPDSAWNEYPRDARVVYGRLTLETSSRAGSNAGVPIFDANFKHPLLGFRCCIDARLDGAFEPLPPDPKRIRDDLGPVPIVGGAGGAAGTEGGAGSPETPAGGTAGVQGSAGAPQGNASAGSPGAAGAGSPNGSAGASGMGGARG
jgi:hypothetical protein